MKSVGTPTQHNLSAGSGGGGGSGQTRLADRDQVCATGGENLRRVRHEFNNVTGWQKRSILTGATEAGKIMATGSISRASG